MSPSCAPFNTPRPAPAGRGQSVSAARRRLTRAFYAARGGSSLLLAAVVAALLVAANQMVESWTDGNLLTGWMVLWGLAFAALALLAAPSRQAAASLGVTFRAWNERRMRAAQDEQYWQLALCDPRIMAEIRRDMGASELKARASTADYLPWRTLLYFPAR